MDLITLAMAKKYSDSKGGYTEAWSITWDGNTEGRESIEVTEGFTLVRVSDKVLTAGEISGSVLTTKNAETGEESSHVIVAEDVAETAPGIVSANSANIMSAAQDTDYEGVHIKAGTYFLVFGMEGYSYYVCSVSKETVHPIDPKYLPGVRLPVVIDLDEWGIDVASLAFGGGGKMDCYINHNAFWKPIPVNGNFLVMAALGAAASYNVPSCFVVGNGAVIGFVCSSTVEYGGSIMTISMQFSCAFDPESGDYSDTTATVIVEQKAIPDL